MIPQPATSVPTNSQQPPKSSAIPNVIIAIAFAMLIVGSIVNWASEYDQAPVSADYDTNEEYQEALDDHNDKIFTLQGLTSLLMTTGVIVLAAGLFYVATNGSAHLPNWVRVSLMAGAMLFLIRLFTTDLSLIDAVTLGILS
jgi:hypothetical protein